MNLVSWMDGQMTDTSPRHDFIGHACLISEDTLTSGQYICQVKKKLHFNIVLIFLFLLAAPFGGRHSSSSASIFGEFLVVAPSKVTDKGSNSKCWVQRRCDAVLMPSFGE